MLTGWLVDMEVVQEMRAPVAAGHVAAAREAIEAAARVPADSLGRFEVSEAVAELHALEQQVHALKLAMLAEAERRHLAEDQADTGTASWAAKLTGTTRAVMAGGLWLARMLQDKYDATREAFAAGRIDVDQVRVIVNAAEHMPDRATPEQRRAAEEGLVVTAADGMNARRLRHHARRMLEALSMELADEQEADMLDEEEERARRETWLTLHDNGDGTFTGKFVIPELQASLLRSALETLSAPRRLSRDKAGRPVSDETVPGQSGHNRSEALGAAFTELCEHLPTDRLARSGIGILVHIDHDRLLDKLGGATLDTGTRISAGQARRLACEAGIIPAVLGGESQVLDLGRARRLHSDAQRQALAIRYESCAAEGCERPFAWCEVHHPTPWSEGGATDLDNAVPLCGWHHGRAHDPRYTWTMLETGEIRFRLERRPARISDRAA